MTKVCAPCPTCGAPYGFHDDEPHAVAVQRIPAHLMLPTSSAIKAARQVDLDDLPVEQCPGFGRPNHPRHHWMNDGEQMTCEPSPEVPHNDADAA